MPNGRAGSADRTAAGVRLLWQDSDRRRRVATRTGRALVVLAVLAALLAVGTQAAVAETVVVAEDGSGDYRSIQNAVDNASAGDTVEVRSGEYRERVGIPGQELDIVAPEGATLNGSGVGGDAFTLPDRGPIQLSGFRIENWEAGIDARLSDANWTVTDSEFRHNDEAILAGRGSGYWTARNNIFRNADRQNDVFGNGLRGDARGNFWDQSTGPEPSQCTNVDCGYFLSSPGDSVSIPEDRPGSVTVAADGTEPYATVQHGVTVAGGDPDVETVEVRPGEYRETVSVLARNISVVAPQGATLNGTERNGDGFRLSGNERANISGFVIENWEAGIDADNMDGNWTVTDSEFRSNDEAILASRGAGHWTARNNIFRNADRQNDVFGDGPRGDARGNYWNQSTGPERNQCTNVDCGYFLSSPDDSVSIPAERPSTLPVAADGSEPYAAIQHGVTVAQHDSTVDTVEVRPGEYRSVDISAQKLSVVAPDGATLDGAGRDIDGIDVFSGNDIQVRGLVIENWEAGIDADNMEGNWTVTDSEFRNNDDAILAGQSTGHWSARNNTFRNDDFQNEVFGNGLRADVRGNYWDQPTGPERDQCLGADCGHFLSSPDDSVSIPADRSTPVTVAADGSEPYAAIQHGVTVAEGDSGVDTVEVRPGEYQSVDISGANISVVAPDGATLNGSGRDIDGVDLFGGDGVSLSGLVIENWDWGIDATNTDSNWTVTDSEFRHNADAVQAGQSQGHWTARNNTIRNGDDQNEVRGNRLRADVRGNYWGQSTGPERNQCWQADCGHFLTAPDDSVSVPDERANPVTVAADGTEPYAAIQHGVTVADGDPDVNTVEVRPGEYRERVSLPARNISVVAPNGATLNGSGVGGDGFDLYADERATISGFLVENWDRGVDASNTDGNWTVTDSEFQNNADAVQAGGSTGHWTVTESVIHNEDNQNEIRGNGPSGDATRNYWGQSTGPERNQCYRADCGYFLTGPDDSVAVPDERPSPLPVAADGTEPYASIQHAVVVAEGDSGVDTVEVRPGEYRERVSIAGEDLSVIAPDGARLNGSGIGGIGFELFEDGLVQLSGFVVENWDVGVRSFDNDANWTVTGNAFRNNGVAIDGSTSAGYWSANRNSIANTNPGNRVQGRSPERSDATRNYWGQPGGPETGQCADADCSNPLDSPPGIGGDIDRGAGVEPGFAFGPTTPANGTSITFQSTARAATDTDIVSFAWQFGDGATASGAQVAHTYERAGTYRVTHTVTTANGETRTRERRVTVEAADEYGIVAVTPHVDGVPASDIAVLDGVAFDLSYHVTVTDGDATDDVTLQVDGQSYSGSRDGDTWVFDVVPTDLGPGAELTATATDTGGTTSTVTRPIAVVELPDWLAAIDQRQVLPDQTAVEFELEVGVPPGGTDPSVTIPNQFGFAEIDIPVAGDQQDTETTVTVGIRVDLATLATNVSVEGAIAYNLTSRLTVDGSLGGTGYLDLQEGVLRRVTASGEAGVQIEYPPPPTGIPNPPIGPVPPAVVRLYPIFDIGLGADATFTASEESTLPVAFESGTLRPQLTARQELGHKYELAELVFGLEEEFGAEIPVPALTPVEGTIGAQAYLRAVALGFSGRVSYPPGDDRLTYDFTVGDGSSVQSRSPVAASPDWTPRQSRGTSPPKRLRTATAGDDAVTDAGFITDDGVADDNPSVTAVDGGHLAAWSRQVPGASVLNGRDIYLSQRSNGEFGDIEPVTDDNTSDFEPALAGPTESQQVAVFRTLNQSVDESAVSGPGDLFPHTEIALTTPADDGWAEPQLLTDETSDARHYAPRVAHSNGTWLVAWASSPENATATDRRVHYRWYDGTASATQTVSGARAPAVAATDDGLQLAYLSMDERRTAGAVTVETFDPATRTVESTRSESVSQFADLALANGSVAWVDETTDSAVDFVAGPGEPVQPVSLSTVDTPQEVTLATSDGVTLVNARGFGDGSVAQVSYAPRVDGEWLPARTYADGSARNLTYWQGASAPAQDGFLSVFAGKELDSEQEHDIYTFDQQFRPDFAVAAEADSANATAGETVTVTYTVENLGARASNTTPVGLRVNGTLTERIDRAGLAPGDTLDGSFETTVGESGTATVVVDPEATVTELDEQNNSASVRLVEPALDVVDLRANRSDELALTATVENPIGVQAPAGEYTMTSGPDLNESGTLPALAPGQRANLTLSAPAAAFDPGNPLQVRLTPSTGDSTTVTRALGPELSLTPDRVGYYEDNETTAVLTVGNTGILGGEAVVNITDADSGDLLGTVSRRVAGSAGLNDTAFTTVDVPLGVRSETDSVRIELRVGDRREAVVVDDVVAGTALSTPQADIALNRTTLTAGEPVRASAVNVSSPGGEIVRLEWLVNGTRGFDNQTAVTFTPQVAGPQQVSLIAIDDRGIPRRVDRTVTVDAPVALTVDTLDVAGQGRQGVVAQGSADDITAAVTNAGQQSSTVAVTLTVAPGTAQTVERTREVTVDAGATRPVTYQNVTGDLPVDPSGYDVTVTTPDGSATGTLSVSVDLTGDGRPARDTTGDGRLNEVRGDDDFNILDVQSLFNNLDSPALQNNAEFFKFQQSGRTEVTILDVQQLFNQLP